MGGGVGLFYEPEILGGINSSLEAALGYKWKNQIFVEATGIMPIKKNYPQEIIRIWPGLKMGFGF